MKQAPRFVTRALVAAFGTVGAVLSTVFVLLTVGIQDRVRATVVANLDVNQQTAVRVEARRRQDHLAMVSLLAENPTLKAALDTWQSERSQTAYTEELVATVQREADKIAARIDADVLALVDVEGRIVASAGRQALAWKPGMTLRARANDDPAEFVARVAAGAFRVIGVPLRFDDALIGSLELGRALDSAYAKELADIVHGHSAIVLDDGTVISTLPPAAAADAASLGSIDHQTSSVLTLGGASYALRHVYDLPPTKFFTLASIDDPASAATTAALQQIGWIAGVALVLAALGSLWLAHAMTRPIDKLSASANAMTIARRFDSPLPATGSSRELDALAGTFNQLIRAVADAEAQTQAAYLGAIRALAAALDARDPYTAGHSERVSALAVAMGKTMSLGDADIDTLRLGALLHDIGKIGVPDDVLGKPAALTPAEFELIRAHPVVGARILRSIPFLAPHLPIVELHHERPDGGGYPYGLQGDAIPLAARIVHVADAYDAMTSARAYRPARSPQDAIAELHRHAGTDFDAASVEALVKALPTLPALGTNFEPTAFQFAAAMSRSAARTRPHAARLNSACLCLAVVLGGVGHAAAQTLPVAVDVVTAVDGVIGSTPRRETAVWFDVFASVRLAEGIEVVARPVISRRAFDGAWQKQMYQLALRYERGAPSARGLGMRLEVGQLASPIGIAMLENRADLNPVVSQHSAYYLPLPRVDPEIPRTYLIAGAYPLGAQATLSARRWDARVAALDSSPVRGRSMLGANKPPRLLNVVGGLGFTPRVGLRLGGAVAHGAYASVTEVRNPARGNRAATMVQLEGEWSFGYTRIVGEWLTTVLETARADAQVRGFWIEATQTLTPRVFVGGRADSQYFDYERPPEGSAKPGGAPVPLSAIRRLGAGLERQRYERFESILGVRITPDLTVRVGHMVRKGYVVFHWDDQLIASVVWQRRMW